VSPSPAPPETDEPAPEKPDIPYATLIAQSLLSHPKRRRTLQEIYAWIQDHHAYFKKQNKSWQSSIRHNLATSPAFVEIGPRPNTSDTGDKKSKRANVEWGISPEYEGLIGNLTAREGDTDKLSTKLNRKKAIPAPPKPPKPTPPIKKESPTTSPAPAPQPPSQTEDKSKLQELVKNMETKGLNMASLLQEALAQMNKRTMKSPSLPPPPSIPTPPPKRPKISTPQTNGSSATPVNVPMPLPYSAAKAAPIPSPAVAALAQAMAALKSSPNGSTASVPLPPVKSEAPSDVPTEVPNPVTIPAPPSPTLAVVSSSAAAAPVPPSQPNPSEETTTSKRTTRGIKRALEE
jgi:hypothetical protein